MTDIPEAFALCFPNPYFTPEDVHLVDATSQTYLVDLSRDSPSPSPARDPNDDDEIPSLFGGHHVPHMLRNVTAFVLQLVTKPLIASNIGSLLWGTHCDGSYAHPAYVCQGLSNGKWTLRAHWPTFYTQRLINCAGLIITALNGFIIDSRGFLTEAIPLSAPIEALHQSTILFPSIVVFLARGWTLDTREFDTEAEVHQHVYDILEVLRFGIAIFGKIVASTIRFGHNSACNPGAGIQISLDDFLDGARNSDHDSSDIEVWLDQVVLDQTMLERADSACGRIFSAQPFTTLFTIAHGKYMTLVPRVHSGVIEEGTTTRIATTIDDFGHQLAMHGF